MTKATKIEIASGEWVTALAYPPGKRNRLPVCMMLAHGAGANQTSGFMVEYATALAARGIGVVTFNFPYTEAGRRLPDRNPVLEACYRKLIQAFHGGLFGKALPADCLVIGGKSMGGRIASQVAAEDSKEIAGLVFLGYPLHPPGRPGQLRTSHLPMIRAPMLFVQGSRDAFGTPAELQPILRSLKPPADLCTIEGGDHSFKVPKRADRTPAEVREFAVGAIKRWLRETVLK